MWKALVSLVHYFFFQSRLLELSGWTYLMVESGGTINDGKHHCSTTNFSIWLELYDGLCLLESYDILRRSMSWCLGCHGGFWIGRVTRCLFLFCCCKMAKWLKLVGWSKEVEVTIVTWRFFGKAVGCLFSYYCSAKNLWCCHMFYHCLPLLFLVPHFQSEIHPKVSWKNTETLTVPWHDVFGLAVLPSGFYNLSPNCFLGTAFFSVCLIPEVYKNRTWANFLHMGVTRVLLPDLQESGFWWRDDFIQSETGH